MERYNGSRRVRESTREDYRQALHHYAFEFFPPRLRLSEITPVHIARFLAWLRNAEAQGELEHRRQLADAVAKNQRIRANKLRTDGPQPRHLADSTCRNILKPIRACLGTAVTEGLIRHNPAGTCGFRARS